MKVKKQTFSGQDLALLFQAFSKKLFVRPTKGDISTVVGNSNTFYFSLSYYDALQKDILNAYETGKFSQSNAQEVWEQLMRVFLSATLADLPMNVRLEDYCETASLYWR